MNELKNKAEALGIKVDARWSEATLAEKVMAAETAPPKPAAGTETEPLFPVRLIKNYKPAGRYEIVGEMALAPRPGLDFPGKIWAGTVVKLPMDEAKRLLENVSRTTERVMGEDNKPRIRDDGSYVTRVVETRFPLAERADAYPA